MPYDFTHMQNLRNKTNQHRGREGKIKTEREENHERLLTLVNKLRVAGGEVGWGDELNGRWVLRMAFVVMSTECYMKVMNH